MVAEEDATPAIPAKVRNVWFQTAVGHITGTCPRSNRIFSAFSLRVRRAEGYTSALMKMKSKAMNRDGSVSIRGSRCLHDDDENDRWPPLTKETSHVSKQSIMKL